MGPLLFCFNCFCLEEEGVEDIISSAWRCFISGSPTFSWEQKLKRVKISLKSWEKNHYQEPSKQKDEIINKMEALQAEMEVSEITREHLIKEI